MEILKAPRTKPAPSMISAGDIIAVRPDGWVWSAAELPNIVYLPGAPVDQKWRAEDREIYLIPKRDRAGNYLTVNPIEKIKILDETALDVKDGGVDRGKLSGGRYPVETRAGEVFKTGVKFELAGVEIAMAYDYRIFNKRRYRWDGTKIVSKI